MFIVQRHPATFNAKYCLSFRAEWSWIFFEIHIYELSLQSHMSIATTSDNTKTNNIREIHQFSLQNLSI